MNPKKLAELRISQDVNKFSGKPFIKNSKVTVSQIINCFMQGDELADILRNFRSITQEDIQACLAYSFCMAEHIELNIGTTTAVNLLTQNPEQAIRKKEEEMQQFYTSLESQAVNQENITQNYIMQIREAKQQMAIANQENTQQIKQEAPVRKEYDLIIAIGQDEKNKFFNDNDHHEQELDFTYDNYFFYFREDQEQWLTYSVKDSVEIDRSMKRNLKVKYVNVNGEKDERVFEGYLTNDRKSKIFLEKDVTQNKTCGRAL